MSESKHHIPDLSKTDFPTWKLKVLGYCQQLGLKKYLSQAVPPAGTDAAGIDLFQSNRSKTAGILLSNMGTANYNRFVTEENEENPIDLWKKLTDFYEEKTSANHCRLYNDFCEFPFKGDLTTYLETVDQHLKMMESAGMKFTGHDVDIKEAHVAENIVRKLPEKFSVTKDFLRSKRPLTIEQVRNTLMNKSRDSNQTSVSVKTEDTAMNASKSKGKSKREYCSGGKHNPKANHPEKDCWQLNGKQSKTAKAAQAEESDGADSASTGNGLRCTIKAMASIKLPNMCYLDSGASTHMFADKSLFKNYRPKSGKVEIADGNTIEIKGSGFVNVIAENNQIIPFKADHVPNLCATLISFGRLFEHGCEVKRSGKSSFVLVREGEVVFKTCIINGTCMIELKTTHQDAPATAVTRH